MQYTILGIILMIIMLLYFKVANRLNIIDKPNERSSHTEITLRGGGIIFWFSALLYFTQHIQSNYFFFTGITLVSLVSFWDDIQSLSNKIRISAHFFAITLIFYDLNVFDLMPVYGVVITYILSIGLINAYNFMDGINGITGLYTLVVMGALLYVNTKIQLFIDAVFINYVIIASLVFLFFNYRKKAKCFAGDIGSIAIAFWVIYLVLKLILATNSIIWLLFLAVYGVDAICTIIHRLFLKQNIFEAHRLHLYQVLSNEYKIQHRVVALYYAIIQIIISVLVVFLYQRVNDVILFIIVIIPLLLIYSLKFYLLNKNNLKFIDDSENN
ncbi:glycosyltransferase family 4 protein [Flavobacterium sp. F-65]|uniref:Glycosyltransferase family 4 protein n=1 Tax=Flavobacterium pisciphilum TaxID=2893755 RepID=A0ABS8MV14_9FLAO|nr:glycosyltransferase family 4 protein [Flavobacterium sp. F-65]MCC9071715.1 glycosyltransferase family 4 protein [Flavobacterium sp. F-65]